LVGENPPQADQDVTKKIHTIADPIKRALILCEALTFTPYFKLNSKNANVSKAEKNQINRDLWKANLFRIATEVGVNSKLLERWLDAYDTALREIGGRSQLLKIGVIAASAVAIAVTGGLAAPALGGAIGGLMGLSGAAATSAGLAFLGGGAIAAGGFGMAGGTIAIIGGGALLGAAGGGLASSRMFHLQHRAVLSQLAKLEASLIVFFSDAPRYSELLKEADHRHYEALGTLKTEIAEPGISDEDERRLSKAAEMYKRAIQKLNKLSLELRGVA
ncbi:MAG: hypothetical protein ACXVCH_09790, partial [Bdellovibrionota bacterium]